MDSSLRKFAPSGSKYARDGYLGQEKINHIKCETKATRENKLVQWKSASKTQCWSNSIISNSPSWKPSVSNPVKGNTCGSKRRGISRQPRLGNQGKSRIEIAVEITENDGGEIWKAEEEIREGFEVGSVMVRELQR
ncbi:hypothetical protein V6N11_031130 [Hibiscus sabdariffa]|uniref:Uncharacterized protein n=2 Tax=Hibiscus sabdariffa TaxID=183260 RepID=A0ABR1ZSV7_9ROSI